MNIQEISVKYKNGISEQSETITPQEINWLIAECLRLSDIENKYQHLKLAVNKSMYITNTRIKRNNDR